MAFNKDKCMRIIASYDDLTITVTRHSFSGSPIYFSKTGEPGTWVENSITLTKGEQAFVKSTGPTASSSYTYTSLNATNNYDIKGQITSLLNDGAGGDIPLTDEYCFCGLFYNRPELVSISEDFLPSTMLCKACYQELFAGANHLSSKIVLPASDMKADCYRSMFSGCSKVSEIEVNFESWTINDLSFTSNWAGSVASTGTFYCPLKLPTETGSSRIPSGWVIKRPDPPMDKCLRFQALADNCTISLSVSKVDSSHYYFSKDGTTWVADTITLSINETCYVKGTNYPGTTNAATYQAFSFSGPVKIISGNIMSLVDNGAGELTEISRKYGFNHLFYKCSNLQSIPAGLLPATTLADGCYANMFALSKGLTSLPDNLFPATTVSYYSYANMFDGCSGLTSLPDNLLPATTLAEYCYYYMFGRCTGLTSLPKNLLPATTLENNCYNSMFYNCSSLKEVHVPFTKWSPDSATLTWLANVSNSGTFYCPDELPDERGTSRIPINWSRKPIPVKGKMGLFFRPETFKIPK